MEHILIQSFKLFSVHSTGEEVMKEMCCETVYNVNTEEAWKVMRVLESRLYHYSFLQYLLSFYNEYCRFSFILLSEPSFQVNALFIHCSIKVALWRYLYPWLQMYADLILLDVILSFKWEYFSFICASLNLKKKEERISYDKVHILSKLRIKWICF